MTFTSAANIHFLGTKNSLKSDPTSKSVEIDVSELIPQNISTIQESLLYMQGKVEILYKQAGNLLASIDENDSELTERQIIVLEQLSLSTNNVGQILHNADIASTANESYIMQQAYSEVLVTKHALDQAIYNFNFAFGII